MEQQQQQPEPTQLDIDKAATAARRGNYVVLVDSDHRRYTVDFKLLAQLAARFCGMAVPAPTKPSKVQAKAEAAERQADAANR